ncbi:MAG: ZIP family metal transporter [Flavobacteriales bacterium]
MLILILLILTSFLTYIFYFLELKVLTPKRIQWITTFSGAYLLGLTFIHILPEIFGQGHHHHHHDHGESISAMRIGFFVFLGFFIQLLLDYFSKGIEHGHAHKSVGWTVVVALSIHSYIEAIPIFSNQDHQHEQLMLGILLHKLPVAIVLANILKKDQQNRSKSLILITLFVLSAPLGILSGYSFSSFQAFHKEILALVVGLLLHISTTILFESSSDHSIKLPKLLAILVGFGMSFLLIINH